MKNNHHELQFLESASNLKKAIHRNHGWMPNSSQAYDIASCLRQGRLFYEAAAKSPLEIKPLQLHYGMVAFAKATTLSMNRGLGLSSLKQSHGIKDISTANCMLSELAGVVGSGGTFGAFNDCVAQLNRLRFIAKDTSLQTINLPCEASKDLEGLRFSLKDILSRIPGLEKLYKSTFSEYANTDSVHVNAPFVSEMLWEVSVSDDQLCADVSELRAVVGRWRSLAPFLGRWTFQQAQFAWGKTALSFGSFAHEGDDLGDAVVQRNDQLFRSRLVPTKDNLFADIDAYFDPLAGGYESGATSHAIRPIDGIFISEFSLQLLVLHLLSSLVRYRPSIWMHAISRTSNVDRPADDAMLALVEKFMSINQLAVPSFVSQVLNPELSSV